MRLSLALGVLLGVSSLVGGAEPVEIRSGLAIDRVSRFQRGPVYIDAIVAAMADGTWRAPLEGDQLSFGDERPRAWRKVEARENGRFADDALRGGYFFATVRGEREEVRILEASSHSLVYVNGEPRFGDPYEHGYVQIPVLLRRGENHFLFACGRGRLRATLLPVSAETAVSFNLGDATLPDIVEGEASLPLAGIVVTNATREDLRGVRVTVRWRDREQVNELPTIRALSLRKVALNFPAPSFEPGETRPDRVDFTLSGVGAGVEMPERRVSLRVRAAGATQKRTFLSGLDGSVQYYALNPARPSPGQEPRGLVLSLHGASVEAINQADAYAPKPDLHIVCPTNRRPFGFDWEDWGRLDAIEVLGVARTFLGVPTENTYLTGHSMGGHGAWHLAVHYPNLFAATAPSAGWISFYSYAGGQELGQTPMERLLMRPTLPSRTLELKENLRDMGVYILHGEADDNVPAAQGRAMRDALRDWHRDLTYFEQPGAGHWWSGEGGLGGAACVDWGGIFALFSRVSLPDWASRRAIRFQTASPAINSGMGWVRVLSQERFGELSEVELAWNDASPTLRGTTRNVLALSLRVGAAGLPRDIAVELDGERLGRIEAPEEGGEIVFARVGGAWQRAGAWPESSKGPQRYGPFKQAFENMLCLVYGTAGNTEENAWSLAKARFDAEQLWYRGNASVAVYSDREFLAMNGEEWSSRDRNVLLYGNAETNAAWPALIEGAEFTVRRGAVVIGDRRIEGEDLACLAVRPRRGSAFGSVAIVAPTGRAGSVVADRAPYFTSGVAYPDLTVLGADMLREGVNGVRAAGYFGYDWSVKRGEFIYRERSPDR